jgi:hypothetical protein
MIDYYGYKVYEDGTIIGIRGWKLKPVLDSNGYLTLNIKKDKLRTIRVHRILAECFLPNPDNLPVVNHKDGNKLNNSISNLEWCTYSYNSIHAQINKLTPKPPLHIGVENKQSKLTEEQVIEIRKSNLNISELSLKYKVSKNSISNVINRKTWKHI